MNVERQSILNQVYASIEAINELRENKADKLELQEDTPLFGRESKLDSLGLVTLVIDVEQRLANEFHAEVSLTDEKAMSQTRSPFRDVKSLVDYISSLLV